MSKSYGGLYAEFAGLKSYSASKRAVFVLDKGGIVQYAWITDDPGVEPPYGDIEKALSSH